MLSNTDPTAVKNEEAGSVFKISKAMELFPAVVQGILCEGGKLFKLIFMILDTIVQYLFPQYCSSDPSDETLAQAIRSVSGLESDFQVLNALSPSRMQRMLRIVCHSPECYSVFHNGHFTPRDIWCLRDLGLFSLEKSLGTSWSSLTVPKVGGNYRK